MTKREDWEETLAELGRRRDHAHEMGGEERLAKHHGKGKLDARAGKQCDTCDFQALCPVTSAGTVLS